MPRAKRDERTTCAHLRVCAAVAGSLITSLAHATDAYPDKPIRLIVPVAPGGGADITARALAQKLAAAWGQQIIVDNRAGAGGTVGMEIGARATPDGYTIISGSMGPLTVDVSLYSKLPFLLPTPEAFGDYIQSEIRKYARVVKDSGARAE